MSAKRLFKMISGTADARVWARALIRSESRGPGDTEPAMRRLEGRYGIPWRTFWTLKYRPPSDVMVGVYLQLKAAYEAECERQEGLYRHERTNTQTRSRAFAPLLRAADALAGEDFNQDNGEWP
jgi:hypothetical protein